MRIVSLDPFITELIFSIGLEQKLVGISERCDYPAEALNLPRVTAKTASAEHASRLVAELCPDLLQIPELRSLGPTHILAQSELAGDTVSIAQMRQELSKVLGHEPKLILVNPRTLEQVYEAFASIGEGLGARAKAVELAQRIRAQVMNWSDNFYERMKNKKITFLSSVEPLKLGGLWIPDLIHLASAVSQVRVPGEDDAPVTWKEIREFRPDVLIVAPRLMDLTKSAALFKSMEKFEGWEELPAVKRGEVVFAAGQRNFYRPSYALIDSMAILVSAIAGLDSGYITPKESFFRLRWLEIQRHRF